MASYTVIGLMSGSSLNGLEICCTEFLGDLASDIWSHRIIKACSIPYTEAWSERLRNAANLCGEDLIKMHIDYGHFLGQHVRKFIDDNNIESVHLIASHGHTIFHQPKRGLTFQLGEGETIASYVRCLVVNNFRSKDVALHGEGAPLVPMGEMCLFTQYDLCLNLGGIANVSIRDRFEAYDVCICNMALNYLVQRLNTGLDFDEDGAIAKSGNVLESVLGNLNSLNYFKEFPPKSLSREWFEENMKPILDFKRYEISDLLATTVEHIIEQITTAIAQSIQGMAGHQLSLLVTGGGALNVHLVDRLRCTLTAKFKDTISIAEIDEDVINYKEAIVIGFLGLRCLLGLVNVSKEVTGADKDSVAGSIHFGMDLAPLNNPFAKDFKFNFRKVSNASCRKDSSNPEWRKPAYR